MSETIFRLLRTSDFTARWQHVNITLYLFHFMQSSCELRRLQEIPLPAPCRKSYCLERLGLQDPTKSKGGVREALGRPRGLLVVPRTLRETFGTFFK